MPAETLLPLVPLVSVPRQARASAQYLMSVDLRHELEAAAWPLAQEELEVTCLLDTLPAFSHQPIGDSKIIVHRFGGSYAPAEFLLKASERETTGSIGILFIDQYGVPVHRLRIENIHVQSKQAIGRPVRVPRGMRRARSAETEVEPDRVPQRELQSETPTASEPAPAPPPARSVARDAQSDAPPTPVPTSEPLPVKVAGPSPTPPEALPAWRRRREPPKPPRPRASAPPAEVLNATPRDRTVADVGAGTPDWAALAEPQDKAAPTTGQPPEALAELEDGDEKIDRAAERHVEKGRYDRAISEYQRLIERNPNDVRALLRVGDLQVRTRAYAQAIATYDRVAEYYAAQGFLLKAIAVYRQVRQLVTTHAPELTDRYGHVAPKLAEVYAVLGLNRDAVAVYDEVATSMQRRGQNREAVGILVRMAELEADNPLRHLHLAEAYCHLSDLDSGMDSFWRAAELLLGRERRADALKVVERMLHFRVDARYCRVAAELYLESGAREDGLKALAKLQICYQADPRDLDTLGLLAHAFGLIDQKAKALEVYKEMARLAKAQGKTDLYQQLLRHLKEALPEGEFEDDGVQPASTIPVHPPESSGALVLDEDLLVEDVPEKELASPAARQLTERESFDASAHARKAVVDAESFRRLRLYPRAIETLHIALEIDPRSIEIRTKLREVLIETGDREGAITETVNLSALHIDRGELAEAESLLREVIDIDPGHVAALAMLEQVTSEEEDPNRPARPRPAGPFLDTFDPDAPLPNYDLEEIGADQRYRADQIRPVDESARDRGPPAMSELEEALDEAEFFVTRGLLDDALKILEEQLSRTPNHPLVQARIAELRNEMEANARPSEGEGLAARGLRAQVSETDSSTHYDLGLAYKEMGLAEDAVNEFEASAQDPLRECIGYTMVGLIRLEQGQLERAVDAYRRALAAQTKTTEQELNVLYDLGTVHEMMGNVAEALRCFGAIAQRDPVYRDIGDRIAALDPNAPRRRPAPMGDDPDEEEFDRVFDELLGKEK